MLQIEGIPFYPENGKYLTAPYNQSSSEESIIGFHASNILNATQEKDIPTLIKTRMCYCIACGQKLDFTTQEPKVCGQKQCLYAIEEILVGDFVTDLVRAEPYVCIFHLWSAQQVLYSSKASKVLDPYPLYFLTKPVTLLRGDLNVLKGTSDYQDLDRLKKLMPALTLKDWSSKVAQWAALSNDKQLIETLGMDTYRWFRFVIMSAKTKLQVSIEFKDISEIPNEAVFYRVVDDYEPWTGNVLYHGSSPCNWFSILRNGLKSLSSTTLMNNGKAYGEGIYLSDSEQFSTHYSLLSQDKFESIVLGIYQTRESTETYLKKTNVYVVPQSQDIRLRGLLFIPQKSGVARRKMDFDFNTLKETLMEKKSTLGTVPKQNKRLMKEFKKLKENKDLNFEFDTINDNIQLWKIVLSAEKFYDKTSPLYNDLKKYNIPGIEMEISFTDEYPYYPPFLRVVSPRFKYQTGHITIGGSICSLVLVPGGWTAACSLEGLIIDIQCLMLEGGARIDEQKYMKPYTLQESKESFVRVAKSHGWM